VYISYHLSWDGLGHEIGMNALSLLHGLALLSPDAAEVGSYHPMLLKLTTLFW
jgi:hypothetical protein